jgi:NAD(P)-dependent dehydrogenase (short-subunit alcohol dehydrogenase family)
MSNKKVALITGANRGIGFETAKQLGEKGVTVIVTARKLETAKETANKLIALGIDADGIKLEVNNDAERKAAAAYISDKYGKLDILINNAGVAPKQGLFTPTILNTTPEEFDYIFQTNFFSVVYLTNELLPLLKKSDAGRIVNLSSILGSLTTHALPDSPIGGIQLLSYNASKAALNMLTIHLASQLKDSNIKVNSAHPGWVKTELGSDQAPMEIIDGAKTSVELALLDANGPTGQFIHLGENLPW